MPHMEQTEPDFTDLNDLASEKVGGAIVFATDDWFAPAESLLKTNKPEWKEGLFTVQGKWMDGWETRRKRVTGHDWCIIKLGAPGIIEGIEANTRYFTGNYAPKISIQAACLKDVDALPVRTGDRLGAKASPEEFKMAAVSHDWTEILPRRALQPGEPETCKSFFGINSRERWTHLRLNFYPDGGLARLRVYGHVEPDLASMPKDVLIDLAAMMHGGICLHHSDVHFGHTRNLIAPGRGENMGDGWETARRLDRPDILEADETGKILFAGKEYTDIKLGCPGIIKKIVVDTSHFKGNFPESCYIEAAYAEFTDSHISPEGPWKMLLPRQMLGPHQDHVFEGDQVNDIGVISHVRFTIIPDGGISRLHLFGYPQIKEWA